MNATDEDFAKYAADNGMTAQRDTMCHAALWHNIQLPHFARLADMIWGGQVTVLPNMTVYAAAQQMARKSKSKVGLSCINDVDGISTTYGLLDARGIIQRTLTIDAATGDTF